MVNFIFKIKQIINQKKGLFLLLLMLTLAFMVLGVIASINFSGGVLVIDLGNISHIQFLKAECSFVSLIFKLILSLMIFVVAICLCGTKSYLFPFGVLFYCYLVYSQTVIFVSMILIYGFFNCVIFALLLFIYTILIFIMFMFIVLECSCFCNVTNYFKTICRVKESNLILYIALVVAVTIIFSIILTILKSFVLLLVY